MDNKEQLSQAIATVERQISEAKSELAKKTLTSKLERLKEELKTGATKGDSTLSTLSKARKQVRSMAKDDFKALLTRLSKKPEYAFLAEYSQDRLKRDLSRTAKPKGYRFVGDNAKKPSPAQIKKGLKDGTVYYEARPIRSDVSRVVKLKEGGSLQDRYSAEVGELQTVVFDGKEKRGYPVYVNISGYAPKTVGVYASKKSAQRKVRQLNNKNKMASGGNIDDLQFKQIASMSGVREKAIRDWAKDNNLSSKEVSNVMMGLGRKQIKVADFVTALTRAKDNSFSKEIIEYAKSNKGYKMENGGMVDLFEDYENIPEKVQTILDKYAEEFGDDFGGMDYSDMADMHKEIVAVGYTFESGLDNMPYGLRPLGVNLNELRDYEDEPDDEMAKGGGIGSTDVQIQGFRKNIMGTLSFELKLSSMRKFQDFIVYPVQKGDENIKIQSGTRIGRIDMSSGKGQMSQSHSSGAYGVHLATDKLVPFQLTPTQLEALKSNLRTTAGDKVGNYGIVSDNSGADQFKQGGNISSFNWKNFTLKELNEALPSDVEISSISTPMTKDLRFSSPEFKKMYSTKNFTISEHGETEISKGSENIYLEIKCYDAQFRNSEEEYEVKIYSKENQKGLKEVANSVIEKMKKGGNTDYKFADAKIKFRDLAKSNNFDIVVAEGRFEVELDSNDKVKSIVHPNGNRHKASECPIYNKYKKEINHYIMYKYGEGGNIDNSYLGRTQIGKSFYGWKAETSTTKKIKGYDWQIITMKRHGGDLVSTATGGKSEKQNGYSTFEYSPFEDPNFSLVRSKPKMVNEKAVTKQHEEAIKIFLEKMNEFSGEKMANGGKLGEKTYNVMNNVGKSKYIVNFHNGVDTHSDGSPFFDMRIFKNQTALNDFIKKLESEGYVKQYASGGLIIENESDLKEVAEYMTTAVKKHRWDLKDLIYYFEKDNGFDYTHRVKIWEEMNGYEMKKTYDNIYEMLKRIVEANGKKMATGGAVKDYTYLPNKNISKIVLKSKQVIGKNRILDGAYIKKTLIKTPTKKYEPTQASAESVFEKLKKTAKELEPTLKFGKDYKFTKEMVEKLLNAGYNEKEVQAIILGLKSVIDVKADNEFYSKFEGLAEISSDYVENYLDRNLKAIKENTFELGLKYPDFNWFKVIKKYKINRNAIIVEQKEEFSNGEANVYVYQCFVGEKIVIGSTIRRDRYKNNKLFESITDSYQPTISDISRPTEYQKERELKAGFNGGYWGVVSSSKSVIMDVAQILLSQPNGYVKDVSFLYNNLGGVGAEELIDNNVKFATGGNVENSIDELYKKSGFINDDMNWEFKLLELLQDGSSEAYEIYQSLNKDEKEQVLQALFEMDNDMGSYGDNDIETTKENLEIILEDAQNGKKYATGGSVSPYIDGMTEKEIMSATVVYDNGGETLDRYTVFTPDGSVYGMSETAGGFNQYAGDDSEIEKGSHLGKRLKSVPKEIQWAVLDRMKEEFADGGMMYRKGGNTKEDYSGNYYSSTDFVETHDLIDLAKETFGDKWKSGGDYDYDTEEIKMLLKELGGGYRIVYVDSENRDKFEDAKQKYFPLIKNRSNDGDIFVIPRSPKGRKMERGGNTGYSYVPNSDIDRIIATDGKEYGQNVLLDGAYVTDRVRKPKMSRTQFEDETFEYGQGGGIGKYKVGVNQYIPYGSSRGINYYYVMDENNNTINKNTGKIYRGIQMNNYKFATKEEAEKYADKLNSQYGEGGSVQKVNLGTGEMDLEDAIKMYEDKIKAQGRVVNARDEDMLEQLKRMRNKYAQGGNIGVLERQLNILKNEISLKESQYKWTQRQFSVSKKFYLKQAQSGRRTREEAYRLIDEAEVHWKEEREKDRLLLKNLKEKYERLKKLSQNIRDGKYAKGGMTEHGLEIGDEIIEDRAFDGDEDRVVVFNHNTKEGHLIDLDKGRRFAKGGGVNNFKIGDNVEFSVPYFESKFDYKGKIIDLKNDYAVVEYYEPLYDTTLKTHIDLSRINKYANGGGIDEPIVRNKMKNDWNSKFNFFLENNETPVKKANLIEMAYKNTTGIDSAIPQSIAGDVDNTFFFVYDYQENKFGELVDLRQKLKSSNNLVDVTMVVDGELVYGDELPDYLTNPTFHQAVDYMFKHDEVEAFDIRPRNKMAMGGEITAEERNQALKNSPKLNF